MRGDEGWHFNVTCGDRQRGIFHWSYDRSRIRKTRRNHTNNVTSPKILYMKSIIDLVNFG